MPSNLKKHVHARMEKTGESYRTALGHVRATAPQQPRKKGSSIYLVDNGGRYMSNHALLAVEAPSFLPVADVSRALSVTDWREVRQVEREKKRRDNPKEGQAFLKALAAMRFDESGEARYALDYRVIGVGHAFERYGKGSVSTLDAHLDPGLFVAETEGGPYEAKMWHQFDRPDYEPEPDPNGYFNGVLEDMNRRVRYDIYVPQLEGAKGVVLDWLFEQWTKPDHKLSAYERWCLEILKSRG